MEKIFGPFNGYFAVVYVREVSGSANKFTASYELWRGAPAIDDANAKPLRQKSVGGLSETVDEAVDIAVQLARLHIAGLPAPCNRVTSSPVQEPAQSWEPDSQDDFVTYQPTMACPLQPSARA